MLAGRYLLVALLLCVSLLLPAPVSAAPNDENLAEQFFAQTGGGSGAGYYVLDDGAQRFWSEFTRLGGVSTLGYPVSRRFTGDDGFSYQAFQRGVLQWHPELGRAQLANTFEWLQQAGRDDWLDAIGVPRPIADDGSAGDWSKALDARLSWLVDPDIKAKFLRTPSGGGAWPAAAAIEMYGLPMSRPEKRGPFVVQRFQRIAFQKWVESVPGMPPVGSVVAVLGGDMLKQAAVISSKAAAPQILGAPDGSSPRGVYLSYNAAGRDNYLQRIYDLASTTEINAVVVDVKTERGYTSYRSAVPLAVQIGAAGKPTVSDPAGLVAQLRKRGLYVIARMAVFKDDLLARSRPAWAVTNAASGGVWSDTAGFAWTDPAQQDVWDYNIALAKEIALHGYDEIQFDFIRFPVVSPPQSARFKKAGSVENRVAAINGFLERARPQLQPLGVKLSADTFGYTTWKQDDLGIGQQIEGMARYLDVISPMLYPSSFGNGIPGFRPGVLYPYEIVSQSVKQAVARLSGTNVAVRPWLQDFADYAYDRRPYTANEVAAQIRGANDGGAAGWMLWNAEVRYTREALAPK